LSARSALGPLLLIFGGGLLLYYNFHPELPLRILFAQHWPWILVTWGGVRVVETILAHFQWRPVPPQLGIGSLLVVALLCAAGTAARRLYEENGFDFL